MNDLKFIAVLVALFTISLTSWAIVKTYTEHDMAKLKFMAEYEKRCKR